VTSDLDGRLAVVVVTHNSAALIPALAESLAPELASSEPCTVVVADNTSTDATASVVGRLLPQARWLPMPGNLGYAAAINAALRSVGSWQDALVLNPDIRLRAGCVTSLRAAQRSTGAGIVVPALVDETGRRQWSLRREPSLPRVAAEAVLGGGRAGRAGWGEMVVDPAAYAGSHATDWASGAAMLVSRECWDQVGPWDETYFLYSEETDFCLRARDLGFVTWFEPGAEVVHLGGESGVSPALYGLLTANRVRLYGRRHGQLAAQAYRATLLVGEAVRAAAGRPTSRRAVGALIRPSTADPRVTR
jgi:GT2 family glycosyltransferase